MGKDLDQKLSRKGERMSVNIGTPLAESSFRAKNFRRQVILLKTTLRFWLDLEVKAAHFLVLTKGRRSCNAVVSTLFSLTKRI